MKRFILFVVIGLLVLSTSAFLLQDPETGSQFEELINLIVFLIVGFFGAPISQLIKSLINSLSGKQVEDRWAVAVTALVAGALAVVQLYLAGALGDITLNNFATIAFAVYGVASIYFAMFKKSEGFLGQKGVLRGYKPS